MRPGDGAVRPIGNGGQGRGLVGSVAGAAAAAPHRAAREAGTIRYSDMKKDLAETVITFLAPIQERRNAIAGKKGLLEEILHEGGLKARKRIAATVAEAREKMGILNF